MKLLKGHISPETAYVVDDYPYGLRLRCKIRYWLEYKKDHGVRFCSQTTNPKKSDIWNKEKCSTYSKISGAMYLDNDNHVTWTGLTEYNEFEESKQWDKTYRAGAHPDSLPGLDYWLEVKELYEREQAKGTHYQLAAKIAIAKANGLTFKTA